MSGLRVRAIGLIVAKGVIFSALTGGFYVIAMRGAERVPDPLGTIGPSEEEAEVLSLRAVGPLG